MALLLFIVGIILFIGLIIVHEFGHFIMARRGGVTVEEFGIFFPPRLFKKKMKGGWNFTINLLPLGGFVKLKGEHDTDTEPGSFGAASVGTKTKIMAAGVVMNLIVALVLLTIVALLGMPKLVDNQFTVASDTTVVRQQTHAVRIDSVNKDSPAAAGGLKSDDQVTAVGPAGQVQSVDSARDLQEVTQRYAGQTVVVRYTRGDKKEQTRLTLNTAASVKDSKNSDHPKGYLGVTIDDLVSGFTMQRSTWSAPIVAVGVTGQFTALTFQGLGHAVAGVGSIIAGAVSGNHTAREHGQTQASSQVGGPIAIFVVLKDGSALGWSFMLFIIAIVSLTLAIMNILPIPALDGGRLWITLIARAFGRPLSARMEERIMASGFAFLMVLIILITIVDVKRFF